GRAALPGITSPASEMACRSTAALALAALLAGAGCSSDEPIDPVQGCRDFLAAWCNQNASCVAPSERARDLEDCHFVNELEVDCSQIKAPGSTYDACMPAVTSAPCSQYVDGKGLPFPPSCRGILVR